MPGLALEKAEVPSRGPGVPKSPPLMFTPRRSGLAWASMTEAWERATLRLPSMVEHVDQT